MIFSVSMIPHTAEVTTLGSKKEGELVNLETDIIGKYVEKLLHPQEEKKETHITQAFLEKYGFLNGYNKEKQEERIMEGFATVEEALEELRNGKLILVTDDEDRENEGDFICAAEFATTENINFMAMHGKRADLYANVR